MQWKQKRVSNKAETLSFEGINLQRGTVEKDGPGGEAIANFNRHQFARYREHKQRMASFNSSGIKRFIQSPIPTCNFVLNAKLAGADLGLIFYRASPVGSGLIIQRCS